MGLSKHLPWPRKSRDKQQARSESARATSVQSAVVSARDLGGQNFMTEQKSNPMTSKRVWDRAYDELAKDQATAGLVEIYLKTLSKMASLCEDDDAFEVMKSDPLQRQAVMASAVKAGQAKIEKGRCENLTGMMGNLVDFIFKFKDVIDLAVSTNSQAALPWAGICIGLQLLLNPSQVSKDQLDGITYVTTRMEWYCSLTEHLLSEDNIVGTPSYRGVLDMLEERVVSLYKKLLLYQMKSVSSYYKSRGWVFLRNMIDWDDWDGQLQDVKEAETAVQKDSDQYSTLHSKTLLGELVTQGQAELKVLGNLQQTLQEYMEEQRRNYMDDKLSNCLQDLYVVDPAAVIDTIQGQNDKLLFAAYEWILHESAYKKFTDWSDPCKVLWLNGPAGTGKSMLIIGIITELSRRSPRVAPGLAYFFFQASTQDRTSPAHALRALIWMLLIQQPRLSSHLQDVHKNSGASAFTNPAATWTLVSIFKAMLRDKDLHPAYLALDALDECETGKTGIQMMRSLVSESLGITNKIKWLLSSRPEVDIYYQMGKATIHGTVLQIDVKTQKGAVDAYIAHKLLELKDIPFEYQPDSLEQISKQISERAQNTFLWVSLVFKGIFEEEMAEYQALTYVKASPPSLNSLYDRLMAKINSRMDDSLYCRSVLEAYCFAYRPLSYDELHILANLPTGVPPRIIVQKCGSFLTVNNNVVRLIHNSAREYLEVYFNPDDQECLTSKHHAKMSEHSIAAMSKILKRNIWNISHDTERWAIEPPETDPLASIQYACEFWINHLTQSQANICDDHVVFAFLQSHLLHWLESLSLIGKLSAVLPSVKKLLVRAKSTPQESKNLIILLNDAERFIRNNIQIMEQLPLQLYGTCLAFSPSKSETRVRHWKERLSLIKDLAGSNESWSPCVQIIESQGSIRGLKTSPNGNILAIISAELFEPRDRGHRGAIQLWDMTSGVCVHTLDNRGIRTHEIAFSPDSKLLAVAFYRTVTILDTISWETRHTLHVPVAYCKSMEFSPCGALLAFAFHDWETYDEISWDEDDKKGWIEIWQISTATRQIELDFKGESVTFSPDGKTLAAVSSKFEDKGPFFCSSVLRLWDVESGRCRQVFKLPNPTDAAAYLPEGKTIVTLSRNHPSHLLDLTSSEILRTFDKFVMLSTRSLSISVVQKWPEPEYAPEPRLAVAAVSSNGKRVAVPYAHGEIDIHDVTTGTIERTFIHRPFAEKLFFSSDGNILASLYSHYVRLWSLEGIWQGDAVGHDTPIMALKLSLDGKTLATGSQDGEIKLWDVATRSLKRCLETKGPEISESQNLQFSPDGKYVVIGDFYYMRVWDTEIGRKQTWYNHFLGNAHSIRTRRFANDNVVAVAFKTRNDQKSMVRLWDVAAGEQIREIIVPSQKAVHYIFLSWNWKLIACIETSSHFNFDPSEGKMRLTTNSTVRLWNVANQEPRHILDVEATSCAISPTSKTLVTSSESHGVQLWDAETGELLQALGLNTPVEIQDFTADGKFLVTGTGLISLATGRFADGKVSHPVISINGWWIERGGRKLLCVPTEHSQTDSDMVRLPSAQWEDTFVVGTLAGNVLFMDFGEV